MGNGVDPWSIFGILIVALIVFWGVRLLRSKIEEQRYKEEAEALAFEQSVISQMGSTGGDIGNDARFIIKDQPLFPAEVSPSTPPMYKDDVEHADGLEASDAPSRQLIARLKAGGLLTSIEGHLELHGDPKGVTIIRLRNGKTGLVVSNIESEAFLRRNSRRADMIFLCANDQNVYVVRRVEDVIAEML